MLATIIPGVRKGSSYRDSDIIPHRMLNKITEETFGSLSSQILFFIEGCSPSIFKAVIKLIYDKAASEPKVYTQHRHTYHPRSTLTPGCSSAACMHSCVV